MCAESASAQSTILNRNYDRTTFVRVEALFADGLKSAYYPYRVTIRNGTQEPLTWSIRFDTDGAIHSYESRFRVRVEAGREVREELLVQVPSSKFNRRSSHRRIGVTAIAPGLDLARQSDSFPIDRAWPGIGMSKRLAQRNLARLAEVKRRKKKGNEYFASSYEDLPRNWKGLTCLDLLLIDETTWYSLTREQQHAAMTWVRFGGTLELYSEKANATLESLGFPGSGEVEEDGQRGRFCLGTVEIREWNGSDLPDNLVDRYQGIGQFDDAVNTEFQGTWELLKQFGTKDFNPVLVLILLVLFAVLVGPVNLFHFAKAGQRHRLFVTTPIISLGAALVIVLIILVQDGTGGKGRRVGFVEVSSHPEQRQLHVLQQQISRTGVMFRAGFQNDEKPVVVPVNIPPSRWNPLPNRSNRANRYLFVEDNYSGDFFRSRNEQGFHLRTVRPTRSRVERRPSEEESLAPALFSSLEFSLTSFYYVDEKAVIWKTRPGTTIPSGQEIKLVRTDSDDLGEWISEATELFARTDQKNIRSLRFRKGRFFGLASDPDSLLISSHPAIRWKNDMVLVSGIVVDP